MRQKSNNTQYARPSRRTFLATITGAAAGAVSPLASGFATASPPVVYYLDNAGSDSNNGLTPTSAFQTVGKVNSLQLLPGQTVLFKAGGIWREQLTVPTSGLQGQPIVFGSYGNGPMPILSGSDVITDWIAEAVSTTKFTANTGATGLTSWWSFGEQSGNRIDSSAVDHNDLTPTNSPTCTSGPTTPRKVVNAQLFVAKNQQQLSRPDAFLSNSFPGKFEAPDISVTFGCWVRVGAATGTNGFIFGKSDSWYLYVEGSAIKVMVWDNGFGSHSIVWNDYLTYTPDQWVHVVGRWIAGGEIALFVNGVKQSSTGSANTMAHHANEALEFGTHKWHGSLDGAIAESFVFSYALGDSQIMDVYSGGLSGVSFTSYWSPVPQNPRQGFIGTQKLNNVLTKQSLVPSSIFYDATFSRAYVRTSVDSAPTTGVEIPTRDQSILADGRSHLAFHNIQVENGRYYGLYITGGGTDLTISGVTATKNASIGLFVYDPLAYFSSIVLSSCEVSFNGINGLAVAAWADSVIADSLNVHDNCMDETLEDYTAGIRYICVDSHVNGLTNSIVRNCRVYSNGFGTSSNRGAGIWFDTTGEGCRINNNFVYGNRIAGLMLEAPGELGVQIVDHNISYGNGIGVLLSRQSWNAVIANNTLYANGVNLCIQGTPGGGDPIKMVGNKIINNITAAALTQEFQALYGAENNGIDGYGNVYESNAFGAQAPGFVQWGAGNFLSAYSDFNRFASGPIKTLSADPLLLNPPSNMNLATGSGAIGSGVVLLGVTTSPTNIGAK